MASKSIGLSYQPSAIGCQLLDSACLCGSAVLFLFGCGCVVL